MAGPRLLQGPPLPHRRQEVSRMGHGGRQGRLRLRRGAGRGRGALPHRPRDPRDRRRRPPSPTQLAPQRSAVAARRSSSLPTGLLCCAANTPHGLETRGVTMDLEKLTDRARGFLQAAQTIAVREHHQRITPAHYAKALLDDEQGMAVGPDQRGGRRRRRGAARGRCAGRQAAGGHRQRRDLGAGHRRRPHPPARPGAGDRDQGQRQLCHGRAHPAGDGAGQGQRRRRGARQGGRHPAEPQRRDRQAARRAHRRHAGRPRTATTRSRNMRATSPRRRARASSTR